MCSGNTHSDFIFEEPPREERIAKLEVGDIFHASDESGSSLICLVVSVSNEQIFARRIPTQENVVFDRSTGLEKDGESRIDSIEPLLAKAHNVLVGMDRRYRLGKRTSTAAKLTDLEKEALLLAATHYPAHPI
ncbi:hypothetical protein GOZ89_24920 [Agrobacterium vitis]|uniref:hypothetical protein n=1 Tax=Agrobacterium vitis TaxID=373 RepID=UPI0012E88F8E|nr:hypothetical protein [Agrobacterium vitis]MVA82647.1 hypothetical protein [Agrobacterium vitis]